MTATTTLQLVGGMTGLPNYNYPAFFEAEARLKVAGYSVINPARTEGDHETWAWEDWMRASLRTLMDADGIALLSGWLSSRGAQIEYRTAEALEMPRAEVDAWVSTAGFSARRRGW